MSKKKDETATHKRPTGRPRNPRGYSMISRREDLRRRTYIEDYLTEVRAGLIQDMGPDEKDLTTAKAVLIDRVVSKLGIVRVIEEYIRENTVMVKGGEVAPALKASYLAYNNSIRLDLQALGLDTRKSEVKDLAAYIQEKYGDESNPKAPAPRAESPLKGQTRVKGTSAKAKGRGKGRGSL